MARPSQKGRNMRGATVVELGREALEEAARPQVLLVDEDDISAQAASRALTRHGCDVVMADSVASARQALARNLFDVVVCDVWVGDGTGIDVFDAARAWGVASMIFMGGDRALPSRIATPGGAVRYVCKPLETGTLVGAVYTACGERRKHIG
jgi:DNA-binding NtrC family response regulator